MIYYDMIYYDMIYYDMIQAWGADAGSPKPMVYLSRDRTRACSSSERCICRDEAVP